MIDNKLEIVIICENEPIPAWLNDLISKLSNSNFSKISCLLFSNNKKKPRNSLSVLAYKKFDSRFSLSMNALEKLDISIPTIYKQSIFLNENFSISKTIESFNIHEIDLIISLVDDPIPQSISKVSKHGVWSLEHGLASNYPSGFIEVIEQHEVIDSKIISIKNNSKKILLHSYSSVDPFSVKRTMNSIYWKGSSLFYNLIKKLILSENDFGVEFVPINSEKKKIGLFTLSKSLYKKYNNYKNNSLKYFDQWTLMYNFENDISYSFKNFIEISSPEDRFWADPFIIFQDNEYFVFFEESLLSNPKGWISYFRLDENGNYTQPESILKKDYHLSYPSIFEFDGVHYMIPESSTTNKIDIFKCIDFPKKWEYHKTILNDISAVDPTIFQKNGKWWLFAGTIENAGISPSDELSLFYSDNPLSDDWISHPLNPIVSDVRKARPAGNIFEQNHNLLRPAQNSSYGYGYGISINKIKTIDESHYVESIDSQIIPNWDSEISGIHTINHTNNLTMIDAKYRRFRAA